MTVSDEKTHFETDLSCGRCWLAASATAQIRSFMGCGSRLAEAVATIQEYHQQAAEQKQVKRAEKKSRTVTN